MPSSHAMFYGASDDLIEVEGNAPGCDEYNSDDATFMVTCQDASMCFVRVRFEREGTWSVALWPIDEGAAMPDATVGMNGTYSARVSFENVKAIVETHRA